MPVMILTTVLSLNSTSRFKYKGLFIRYCIMLTAKIKVSDLVYWNFGILSSFWLWGQKLLTKSSTGDVEKFTGRICCYGIWINDYYINYAKNCGNYNLLAYAVFLPVPIFSRWPVFTNSARVRSTVIALMSGQFSRSSFFVNFPTLCSISALIRSVFDKPWICRSETRSSNSQYAFCSIPRK